MEIPFVALKQAKMSFLFSFIKLKNRKAGRRLVTMGGGRRWGKDIQG
jgi:hypothetical protein